MDRETTMQEQDNKASYKYLGVEEGHQVCHKQMRKTTAKEYQHRTRRMLKTYLFTGNKIKAMNQQAVQVFQ